MLLVKNRRALFDYKIQKTWLAGIVLAGHEVKSIRLKQANLSGSYVKIINQEPWLINAKINPYQYATLDNYDPSQSRKLLLTKKEIHQLLNITETKKVIVVPLEILLMNNRIKIKIGAGQAKKEFEKRKKIKDKDLQRELAKKIKQSNLKI